MDQPIISTFDLDRVATALDRGIKCLHLDHPGGKPCDIEAARTKFHGDKRIKGLGLCYACEAYFFAAQAMASLHFVERARDTRWPEGPERYPYTWNSPAIPGSVVDEQKAAAS